LKIPNQNTRCPQYGGNSDFSGIAKIDRDKEDWLSLTTFYPPKVIVKIDAR